MSPEYTPSTGNPGPPPPPVAHPAGPVPPSAPKCSRLCPALCSLPCGKARFQRPASACGGKPSLAAAAALISCPRNNRPGAWHLVFAKSLQLLVPVTYHTSQHLISGWAEGVGFAARWQLPGGQTTLFMDGARLVGTGGVALFHCFWTSQGPHLLELLHTILGLFRECECSSKILLLVLVFAKSSNQPFPSRGWGEHYCTLRKRGERFLCVFSSRQGTS